MQLYKLSSQKQKVGSARMSVRGMPAWDRVFLEGELEQKVQERDQHTEEDSLSR
jgi:hypothetical protein